MLTKMDFYLLAMAALDQDKPWYDYSFDNNTTKVHPEVVEDLYNI